MGTYLNPGKGCYQMACNSEIFIDKSEMLSSLNAVVIGGQYQSEICLCHETAPIWKDDSGRYALCLLWPGNGQQISF